MEIKTSTGLNLLAMSAGTLSSQKLFTPWLGLMGIVAKFMEELDSFRKDVETVSRTGGNTEWGGGTFPKPASPLHAIPL